MRRDARARRRRKSGCRVKLRSPSRPAESLVWRGGWMLKRPLTRVELRAEDKAEARAARRSRAPATVDKSAASGRLAAPRAALRAASASARTLHAWRPSPSRRACAPFAPPSDAFCAPFLRQTARRGSRQGGAGGGQARAGAQGGGEADHRAAHWPGQVRRHAGSRAHLASRSLHAARASARARRRRAPLAAHQGPAGAAARQGRLRSRARRGTGAAFAASACRRFLGARLKTRRAATQIVPIADTLSFDKARARADADTARAAPCSRALARSECVTPADASQALPRRVSSPASARCSC